MQLNGSLASGPLYPSQVTALGLSIGGPTIASAEMQEMRPVALSHPDMTLGMSSPRLLLNPNEAQQHTAVAAYGNGAAINHSPNHLPPSNGSDVLNNPMVPT